MNNQHNQHCQLLLGYKFKNNYNNTDLVNE